MKFTITITIDNGKESREQRKARIAETHNGRTTQPRVVGDKRRKAPRYRADPRDEG